jgi:hypothetical protein
MTESVDMTDAELDQAILVAQRELSAAARLRPRNPQAIADAQAKYDALLAIRGARNA